MPFAAVGLSCLGLIPAFGAADQPLHWLTILSITSLGVLLLVRHVLTTRRRPLAPVTPQQARVAGQQLFWITAVLAAIAVIIITLAVRDGDHAEPFSLALPVVGFGWAFLLAFQISRSAGAVSSPTELDEAATQRHTGSWDGRSSRPPPAAGGSSHHASA